jgi:hypothetical protein
VDSTRLGKVMVFMQVVSYAALTKLAANKPLLAIKGSLLSIVKLAYLRVCTAN